MRVTFHAQAGALGDAAETFWMRDEAMNNLVIGLVSRLRGTADGSTGTFAAIENEASEVVGTAFRTPPNALVLSAMSEEALACLVPAIVAHDPALDGVMGPVGTSDAFARLFSAQVVRRQRQIMHEGVYVLDALVEPRWAEGALRHAEEADRPLLIEWVRAFAADAHLPPLDIRPEAVVLRHLANRTMFLWEVSGRCVSMAAQSGSTKHGARVGAVYTPRELRGKGFATSCTAALTKHLLASGRRFCCLFTDLANPTSNAIYQRLGYRQVGEYRWWGFEADSRE